MLPETLESLYSDDISAICNILNKTVYITDLQEKESHLFHTGFSFLTHKRKKMCVYYQLATGILVRGPESTNPVYGKIPELIGLLCRVGNEGYIKDISLSHIATRFDIRSEILTLTEIAKPEELSIVQKSLELKNEDDSVYSHSEFLLVEEEKVLFKFPLYKEYDRLIFYNKYAFEEYTPSKYQRSTPDISMEEWYRQEFGDDAETAWWNTH